MGCAVLHPFAGGNADGLPRRNVQRALPVRDPKRASEHEREFIELRSLAGFDPTPRAAHKRNAQARLAAVDASNEFVNEFWFVARSRNAGWSRNEFRHKIIVYGCRTRFSQARRCPIAPCMAGRLRAN